MPVNVPSKQAEEAKILQEKLVNLEQYLEEEWEPGREVWEIGKKCSEYSHSLYVDEKGKICRRPGYPDTVALFSCLFPGILDGCKGDKQKEAVLFFVMQTFKYGLRFPGLGYSFAENESREILRSKPGDKRRDIFF